jgi:transcriptional regulator GlxA family with amidase domain
VDKIAQMLIESTLSVTQIALALGFSSDAHISRYFSQKRHTTPLQYRGLYGKKQ